MVPGGIYLHLTAYWFQAYLHRSFTALRLEFILLSLLFLFLPLACKIKLLHIYTLCHVCKICRSVPLLEILIPEGAFSYCPSNCPLSTCNKQTKNQNTFLQRTCLLWKDIERWRIYCFFWKSVLISPTKITCVLIFMILSVPLLARLDRWFTPSIFSLDCWYTAAKEFLYHGFLLSCLAPNAYFTPHTVL